MNTYYRRDFKIKKGLNGEVEILINVETQVVSSLFQFPVHNMLLKVAQIIRKETMNMKYVTLKAKVISVDKIVTVGHYPDIKQKREVQLADETGDITLVFWRDRAESITFQQGDVIRVENAATTAFNGKIMLTATAETIISPL